MQQAGELKRLLLAAVNSNEERIVEFSCGTLFY